VINQSQSRRWPVGSYINPAGKKKKKKREVSTEANKEKREKLVQRPIKKREVSTDQTHTLTHIH
jgi:hypothetical protein